MLAWNFISFQRNLSFSFLFFTENINQLSQSGILGIKTKIFIYRYLRKPKFIRRNLEIVATAHGPLASR